MIAQTIVKILALVVISCVILSLFLSSWFNIDFDFEEWLRKLGSLALLILLGCVIWQYYVIPLIN